MWVGNPIRIIIGWVGAISKNWGVMGRLIYIIRLKRIVSFERKIWIEVGLGKWIGEKFISGGGWKIKSTAFESK